MSRRYAAVSAWLRAGSLKLSKPFKHRSLAPPACAWRASSPLPQMFEDLAIGEPIPGSQNPRPRCHASHPHPPVPFITHILITVCLIRVESDKDAAERAAKDRLSKEQEKDKAAPPDTARPPAPIGSTNPEEPKNVRETITIRVPPQVPPPSSPLSTQHHTVTRQAASDTAKPGSTAFKPDRHTVPAVSIHSVHHRPTHMHMRRGLAHRMHCSRCVAPPFSRREPGAGR